MNAGRNDLPDGTEFNQSAFAIVYFDAVKSFKMQVVSLETIHDEKEEKEVKRKV